MSMGHLRLGARMMACRNRFFPTAGDLVGRGETGPQDRHLTSNSARDCTPYRSRRLVPDTSPWFRGIGARPSPSGESPHGTLRARSGSRQTERRSTMIARTFRRSRVTLPLGGDGPCTDDNLYTPALANFAKLERPLIWVPGDNDWTDCWGRYGPGTGGQDPIERLNHERQFFAP